MKQLIIAICAACIGSSISADSVEISSIKELAEYAARSGNVVRMKPGVYRISDYFTDEIAAEVVKTQPQGPGRQPAWMLHFAGSDNTFQLDGVVLEIDTSLYRKLPKGYTRCLWITGSRITVDGLVIRNVGPQQGSNGNILSLWGSGNTVSNVVLYVSGSQPYGFGDLLGKGGPNLVGLQKQSGIMVAGQDQTLKRCKVISRAFGHCFYIQKPDNMVTDNIRLEDCYAEGTIRTTADMLRDQSGLLSDLQFRTISENRDGRYLVVPGYMKSLSEDGFRTYGGTSRVTLVNCTAVNTRAGFEVNGPDDGNGRTVVEGGTAIGCERGYLIGSNVTIRRSRGDLQFGPLLYLRGGKNSDIELELTGGGSDYTVHALATLAGEGHRVHLFTNERNRVVPAVPIMLGYAMPANAEMASPIRPLTAKDIKLVNDLPRHTIIRSAEAVDCELQTQGLILDDAEAHMLPKPQSRPTTSTSK